MASADGALGSAVAPGMAARDSPRAIQCVGKQTQSFHDDGLAIGRLQRLVTSYQATKPCLGVD
jgi:hypothetical protein